MAAIFPRQLDRLEMYCRGHATGPGLLFAIPLMDFAQFKRRGNLQVGGKERRGVPECRGTDRKNPLTPATDQGDGGRWETVCRTRPGALGHGAPFLQRVGVWPRKEPQQDGRGAGDQVGLTLGLHTQWVRTSWKVTSSCQAAQTMNLRLVRRWVGT